MMTRALRGTWRILVVAPAAAAVPSMAGAPTVADDVFIQRFVHAANDGWTGILLGMRMEPGTYSLDFGMWPVRAR